MVKGINFVEGTGGDRCGLEPGRRCGGDLSHVERGRDPDRGTEQNYPRQFTSHAESSFFPCHLVHLASPSERRADTIRHFGRRRQRARSGLVAVPLFTIECRYLPYPG